MKLQFFVPMQPPTVTHHDKEIFAFMRNGKPKAVLHDSAELKAARQKMHAHLASHKPHEPFQGALRLTTMWCFEKTGKHKNAEYRTSKPDTDNLSKMLKDVMTDLKFWKDDAQVASELCEKFWADVPGIFIKIETIGE